MEVIKAQRNKAVLEGRIKNMVEDFEKETGIEVIDVSFFRDVRDSGKIYIKVIAEL